MIRITEAAFLGKIQRTFLKKLKKVSVWEVMSVCGDGMGLVGGGGESGSCPQDLISDK